MDHRTGTQVTEEDLSAYSQDLREGVVADCDAGVGTMEVAAKHRVSQSWVRRLKERRRATGSILPKKERYGRQAKWPEHAEMLIEIVWETADIMLKELKTKFPGELSIATVWRALRAMDLSLKKVLRATIYH